MSQKLFVLVKSTNSNVQTSLNSVGYFKSYDEAFDYLSRCVDVESYQVLEVSEGTINTDPVVNTKAFYFSIINNEFHAHFKQFIVSKTKLNIVRADRYNVKDLILEDDGRSHDELRTTAERMLGINGLSTAGKRFLIYTSNQIIENILDKSIIIQRKELFSNYSKHYDGEVLIALVKNDGLEILIPYQDCDERLEVEVHAEFINRYANVLKQLKIEQDYFME
jgi:hypothetical protein